jgi:hypothetical protein
VHAISYNTQLKNIKINRSVASTQQVQAKLFKTDGVQNKTKTSQSRERTRFFSFTPRGKAPQIIFLLVARGD